MDRFYSKLEGNRRNMSRVFASVCACLRVFSLLYTPHKHFSSISRNW